MEALKQQLLRALSGTISLDALAEWIYADAFVNEHIDTNEQILELLLLNLNDKRVLYELEKYCFKYYGESDCLTEIIHYSCEALLTDDSDDNVTRVLRIIAHFYVYDTPYKLLSQLYFFTYDWDLAKEGVADKQVVRQELRSFAHAVNAQLANSTADKEQLLLNGLEWLQAIYPYTPNPSTDTAKERQDKQQPTTGKWFKFWKK